MNEAATHTSSGLMRGEHEADAWCCEVELSFLSRATPSEKVKFRPCESAEAQHSAVSKEVIFSPVFSPRLQRLLSVRPYVFVCVRVCEVLLAAYTCRLRSL